MRHPRFKLRGEAAFYHCYNRVSGSRRERPFERAEKEKFVRILQDLRTFYSVDVVAYQVMSNHFHLILHVPDAPPSPEETCRRYKAFYPNRFPLEPGTPECERIAARMADLSVFMGDLQQRFTTWYNRTRPDRRRGSLWANRFKNTLLDNGNALWACWAYVEMNPVRAGMVQDPAEYRFSSYGAWTATGRHPFAGTPGVEHAYASLAGLFLLKDMQALRKAFQVAFVLKQAQDRHAPAKEIDAQVEEAKKPLPFHVELRRHSRYWVDGMVIGTELFVRDAITHVRGPSALKKRRLRKAVGESASELCCFKTLRSIQA